MPPPLARLRRRKEGRELRSGHRFRAHGALKKRATNPRCARTIRTRPWATVTLRAGRATLPWGVPRPQAASARRWGALPGWKPSGGFGVPRSATRARTFEFLLFHPAREPL